MEEEIRQIEDSNKKENVAISVRKLKTQFFTYEGIVKALDEVSLDVRTGEIYGLVGESGCGKSVTATSVMDLVPDPPGRIISGDIYINGFNILWNLDKLARIDVRSETNVKIKRNSRELKRHTRLMSQIRGKWISMVFQDPGLSLNPVLDIEKQLIDPMIFHDKASLADSIIRRETIKKSEVELFIEEIGSDKPPEAKRKAVSDWCSEHGLSDLEKDLQRMVRNNEETEIIHKKLLKTIKASRTGINVSRLRQIRKYETAKRRVFDLELELIMAEHKGDLSERRRLETQLRETRSRIPSGSFILSPLHNILDIRFTRALKEEARKRAIRMLEHVNLADPERIMKAYPHELSGGMQQRIMIAMALSLNPKVLIADEPTTALDVTTQAQILDLVGKLNKEVGTSVIFITHDLAVVAQMCDHVGVMYAGNLVEETSVEELFSNPMHPYTIGLLKSLPRPETEIGRDEKFDSIGGDVPNLVDPPKGCRFHTRCSFKLDVCDREKPELVNIGNNHKVACFLYSDKNEKGVSP